MPKRVVIAGLGILIALSATGCAFHKPTLKFKAANIREADLEGVTLDVVFSVNNRNRLGLQLSSVDYSLEVEGRQVLSGKPDQGGEIRSRGVTELDFPARVRFQDLVPVVPALLERKEARYQTSGKVGIETPVGLVELPFSHSGTFPLPKLPDLALEPPVINSLSPSGARLTIPIKITNGNPFPLRLKRLSARLTIAEAEIGMAELDLPQVFAPHQSQIVSVPVEVDFAKIKDEVARAIQAGRAEVKLHARLQSGCLSLPVEHSKTLDFQ